MTAMTTGLIASGLVAGLLIGVVLRRSDLWFQVISGEVWRRRVDVLAAWLLAVGVGATGLCIVVAVDPGLTRGLPFDPVSNIAGGLMIGLGMVVARSCVAGLLCRLGAGMVGALSGLFGWFLGELAAREVDLPGSAVLAAGDAGSVPHLLHLPRIVVALVLLTGSVWWVARRPASGEPSWDPRRAGPLLGAALVAAWALAGWAGASFGPSSVGAPSQLSDKLRYDALPDWWMLTFLAGIVVGSLVVSAARRQLRVRGQTAAYHVRLVVGGALLGAGGRIGAGDDLGHALSGVALLSVSSWVVVLATAGGVALGALGRRAFARDEPAWPTPTNGERGADDVLPERGGGGAGDGSRVAALAAGGWAKFTQPSPPQPKTPSDCG